MFVEANFETVPRRNVGDELVFICPQPGCQDKSGNRSVNVKTGKTACFRCNVNGVFVWWVRKLGYDVTDEDRTTSSIDELKELLAVKPSVSVIPVKSSIQLPQGCRLVADNLDSAYVRAIKRMAESKHLTLDDMIEAEVMFTRTDPMWEPYAIFPIKEWDRLVLFQGRLVDSRLDMLSKRFPSNKVVNFGAKYWVYNIDELRRCGKVAIVVESILNVLSLRKKLRELGIEEAVPVCIFKHAISKVQATKILACRHLKEVCFLYDADATGDAWKQAMHLSNHVQCTIATMPRTKERPTLDANDDVDAAWQAFCDRRYASASEELMAKF